MSKLFVSALGAAVAVAGLALPSPARAVALYFEKAIVKTGSEATCLRFASDVARNQGFANVRKSNMEVAGEKGGAYVAITCVGRGGQPAVAVVMSVASDFNLARQVGHAAAARIKGVVCFDSPC